jgi:hypothetical protein
VLLAVSEPADAVTGLINSGKFAFTIMFMQGIFVEKYGMHSLSRNVLLCS